MFEDVAGIRRVVLACGTGMLLFTPVELNKMDHKTKDDREALKLGFLGLHQMMTRYLI